MRRWITLLSFATGAVLLIGVAALPAPTAASSALMQRYYCSTGSPDYCAHEKRCWGSDFWGNCTERYYSWSEYPPEPCDMCW